jgi:hypothetical protein
MVGSRCSPRTTPETLREDSNFTNGFQQLPIQNRSLRQDIAQSNQRPGDNQGGASRGDGMSYRKSNLLGAVSLFFGIQTMLMMMFYLGVAAVMGAVAFVSGFVALAFGGPKMTDMDKRMAVGGVVSGSIVILFMVFSVAFGIDTSFRNQKQALPNIQNPVQKRQNMRKAPRKGDSPAPTRPRPDSPPQPTRPR